MILLHSANAAGRMDGDVPLSHELDAQIPPYGGGDGGNT